MNEVENSRAGDHYIAAVRSTGLLWPKHTTCSIPASVPEPLASDIREAHGTLPVSTKASAALSRRCLQTVLHERFSIRKANLQQEIQEFISTLGPPTHLAQQLDAVRAVGNFAAHPIKDTNTGAVTEVEEGEAELLLETVESLFDYAFVQPAKWVTAKAAINAKLRAAGRPELP